MVCLTLMCFFTGFMSFVSGSSVEECVVVG